MLDTREKLRAVQLALNHNISLETELRLFNIILVPAVLTILALVLGLVRRQRRARGSGMITPGYNANRVVFPEPVR